MAEMQRAVTLAERRALDSVTNERMKMERLLIEAASVAGVPASSISSTSAIAANSSRKQDMNILDVATNAERLGREEKAKLERVNAGSSDDYLQEMKQNETSNTDETPRAVKNKVSFYVIDFNLFCHD